MKIKNLFAVAALLLSSSTAFAGHVISPVTLVDAQGINYNVVEVYANENIAGAKINQVNVAITNDFSGAVLNIPDEVTLTLNAGSKDENETPIEGAFKFRVVGIIADAFRNNRNITTVNIGKYVTSIGENAFNSCTGVTAINFAEESALTTLGNYCFGNTPKLTTLDFDNTKVTNIVGREPFYTSGASADTKINNYLTTLKLNKLETIGTALSNLTALNSVEFSALTQLDENAFKGDAKLLSLELPATCQTIAADALKSSGIATLTVNSLEAKPQIFGGTVGTALTTVEFKGVSVVTIPAGTFPGNKLTSVTFAEVKSAAGDIQEGAFVLKEDAASTITINKISTAAFAKDAFTGPNGIGTNKVALNLGDVAAALSNRMVSQNVGAATTGTITAELSIDVFGSASTISFGEITKTSTSNGKLKGCANENETLSGVTFTKGIIAGGIPSGSFVKCTKLATVEFKVDLTANAIAAGAFGIDEDDTEAGIKNITAINPYRLTVIYRPTVFTAAFVEKSFLNAAHAGDPRVKFVTNLIFASKADAMFDVEISFEGMTREIEMLAPEGQTSWYGKFVADGTNYMIANTNEAGKRVVVYEAYIDENDESKTASIVMLPLTRTGNYFVVKEGQAVIVRAWGEGNITAEATTLPDTHNYDGTFALNKNDIRYYEADPLTPTYDYLRVSVDASVLNDVCLAQGFSYMYGVLNLAKNTLGWGNFTATAGLMKPYTLYVYTHYQGSADRGARLNVIWADGSEDATAIQTVKKANIENGAMYNLSGQKVNASYKGVVIKDGKKMIQK